MGLAQLYDRAVLPKVLTFACGMPAITQLRQKVVPLAKGKVMEIGCGGGLNQQFYDTGAVTLLAGLDPHPQLLEAARHNAADRGLAHDLREGVAEDMPFASGSFDTVLCTYTLCSVAEPDRAIAEMKRVLAPGGRLLFLEHGSAPDPGVARWQRRIEPVWRKVAGGCHLTRPVSASLRRADLHVEPRGRCYVDRAPKVLGWMEWGIAHKPG